MKEERQPEPGELVWDLGVQERQQATDVVHAGYLKEREEHSEVGIASFSSSSSGLIRQEPSR